MRPTDPAAFGRLCVETSIKINYLKEEGRQPPSGGCVLKLPWSLQVIGLYNQPPSGGCVLKQSILSAICPIWFQPPSGGCVLKLGGGAPRRCALCPAAFGRLCVETSVFKKCPTGFGPAAFGRLCVETSTPKYLSHLYFQPPSGGCVLKHTYSNGESDNWCQPPSGGCVLKRQFSLYFKTLSSASRLRAAVC